ncbi:MAG: hypothetical protein WC340_13520 [Kiritimatiellia bacterium]
MPATISFDRASPEAGWSGALPASPARALLCINNKNMAEENNVTRSDHFMYDLLIQGGQASG